MCIECKKCGRKRDFSFKGGEFNSKVSKLKGGEEYITHGWKALKLFGVKEFKDSLAWVCPSCRAGVPERDERELEGITALSQGKCPVHHTITLEVHGDVGLCPFCFEGAYLMEEGVTG